MNVRAIDHAARAARAARAADCTLRVVDNEAL